MTMTFHDRITQLEQALAAIDAALDDIVLIAGDVPESDDEPALVDALRDRATAIRGELRHAIAAAHGGSLGDANASSNEVARRVRGELASAANYEEIAALAVTLGGPWTRWSGVVREALDAAAVSCDAAADALLDCWRELASQHRIPA
jgi:hypothetical protein